ncbi:cartilage matrix protein-like [Montipora capricornis]|uniref:cartilage matrix protein-like n=1 Tax=Montipora capricornis TaxID=246305 RepID=UPI0035F184BC
MPRLGVQLAIVISVIFFLSEQSSANVLRPAATLPKDPHDEDYQKFRNIPSIELMDNNGVVDRRRRSTGFNQDVVIVLDGSGSAGRCEFEKVKEALNRTLETLYASNSKIAAITFSSSATVNFKFLDPSTAIERITQISFPGGGTNTAGALDKVMELFDDTSSGVRPQTRKFVWLFTDGQSNNKDLTIEKARQLKTNGVKIYVMGFGAYNNGINEMVGVSSHPYGAYLFRVKDFGNDLTALSALKVKEVRPGEYSVPDYTSLC